LKQTIGFLAAFFGAFLFALAFVGVGFEVGLGLGLKGRLGVPFRLIIHFLFVDGASIFSMPKASQKLPISFRAWALSAPYLACNLSSLHKFKPSDLTIPNNCPKVSRLNGISLVAKFCLSLLRILSPNSFGRPTMNLSFQKTASPSSHFKTLVRKTSLYRL